MKLLFSILCLGVFALPVQAALPAAEEAYVKSEEALFDAADKDHDGQLQRNETEAALLGGDLEFSPETRAICIKAGVGMMARFAPAPDSPLAASFKPLGKRFFLNMRRNLFSQGDLNHDGTVTAEEQAALDQTYFRQCTAKLAGAAQDTAPAEPQQEAPPVPAAAVPTHNALPPPEGGE